MSVVFWPYLDRVTTTDSDSPENEATTGGLSTRRVALGAAVAGVGVALLAWRRRRVGRGRIWR